MNILVCGANGFIGRHLVTALTAAGHRIIRGVRLANEDDDMAIDYMRDLTPQVWLPRLQGVDVVINAVGILTEDADTSFDSVHRDAPKALFAAAAMAGVKRVIQISALSGTNEDRHLQKLTPYTSYTPYMRSKREADAALMSQPLRWLVLRPSLLVGIDGASSRLFRTLASLPVQMLPGRGEQLLRPLHIEDLCSAALQWLQDDDDHGKIAVIDAVGPDILTYKAMLSTYRRAMDLPPAKYFSIPMPLMRACAYLARPFPQKILTLDTLKMLEENNTADAENFVALLKRKPRSSDAWFNDIPAENLRVMALSGWITVMFRAVLALMWLVTGVLSLGIYPVPASLELLAPLGLHGSLAVLVLYAAALMDIGIGFACLLYPSRLLWMLQLAVIAAYTVLISIFLPQFWLHPFGPILKNIPILAMLFALLAGEKNVKTNPGKHIEARP